ncbi:hypothetical protein [Spirosoma linguale]
MEATLKPLKYGVGIDMKKKEFHACVSSMPISTTLRLLPRLFSTALLPTW